MRDVAPQLSETLATEREDVDMTVEGTWLADADWGNDDSWQSIAIEFLADGTWAAGGDQSNSRWTERDGLVLMTSLPSGGAHTVFCAVRVDDAMVGISSNTSGTHTGVWRARRVPV